MKIYTKTGDRGTTSLMGGGRVDKSDLRIRAYGEVDELNSLIGLIIAELESRDNLSLRGVKRRSNLSPSHSGEERSEDSRIDSGQARMTDVVSKLFRIQNELLVLGSDLATPMDVRIKVPRINRAFVTRLEKEIDKWTASLSPLRNFILPGGGRVASQLHLARTVARRAERSIVDLSKSEKINNYAQTYINRLSDWLFTLARYMNKLENQKETIWSGKK